MPHLQTPKLVHLGAHGQGTAICPQCGASGRISAPLNHNLHKPLMVNCPCGKHFRVLLNTRKFYRKTVCLSGTYTPPGEDTLRRMTVEDLSLTGVYFRPLLPQTLQTDDVVKVTFCLDDPQQTMLCQHAIVRWIASQAIGAEFCNLQAFEKVLGFYLRPGL